METNLKVVGFANQSINGVNVNNQGFDLEYDGNILSASGFSGDKYYYTKLNNEQLLDLLQAPSSHTPLEHRILNYNQNHNHNHNHHKQMNYLVKKTKSKTHKKSNTHKQHDSRNKSITKSFRISSYKSPNLRSEYGPKTSIKKHSKTSVRHKSSKSSKSSKSKTIY
jgi:hypothetical protein